MPSPKQILVVDDDAKFVELLDAFVAQPEGWHVRQAGTLAAAVDEIKETRFDLIVVDHALPDGDGLDVITNIRARSPETPVLFLTGAGSENIALEALSLGATEYRSKDPDVLVDVGECMKGLIARASDLATAAKVVPARSKPSHEARPNMSPGAPSARAVRVRNVSSVSSAVAEAAVEGAIRAGLRGAAVFDSSGGVIAARLPSDMDPSRLGACAFQIHAQVGITGRLTATSPRAYIFIVESEQGFLGFTTTGHGELVSALASAKDGENGTRTGIRDLVARLRAGPTGPA
ncbi:MAG: response regulator transcription factor [Thermoplasmatota archaeon]